jgi:hypothetical protein
LCPFLALVFTGARLNMISNGLYLNVDVMMTTYKYDYDDMVVMTTYKYGCDDDIQI